MTQQYCLFHNIVLVLQLLSGTEDPGKFLKPQSFEAFAVTLLSAVVALEPDWRPRCLQMNSPAAITLPRSTPVLIPNPLSMYTTSSVATFPDAPFAYGQPPRPATEESTMLTPIWREMRMFERDCP